MRHFVREVTIGTSPLDALEKTAWKRLSITKGRYSGFTAWLMHGTNLYALPTRCRHILPIFFFFEYFILRGIFIQNRGKKTYFLARGMGPNFGPKNSRKHWFILNILDSSSPRNTSSKILTSSFYILMRIIKSQNRTEWTGLAQAWKILECTGLSWKVLEN